MSSCLGCGGVKCPHTVEYCLGMSSLGSPLLHSLLLNAWALSNAAKLGVILEVGSWSRKYTSLTHLSIGLLQHLVEDSIFGLILFQIGFVESLYFLTVLRCYSISYILLANFCIESAQFLVNPIHFPLDGKKIIFSQGQLVLFIRNGRSFTNGASHSSPSSFHRFCSI